MAKYLAHQKHAARSVDLISETIFLVRALRPESFKTDEVVEMSDKGLDFLYECIQGPCESNQKLLVDRKVTDALRVVLEAATGTHYFTNQPKRKELLKRAGDAIQICIGLIDGDKAEMDFPFTSLVVHNINFEAVIKVAVEGYKESVRSASKVHAGNDCGLGYPDLTMCGFDAFNLLTAIATHSAYGKELIEQAWESIKHTVDRVYLEYQNVDNAEVLAYEHGLDQLNRDEFANLLNALHHTDYASICSEKNVDGAHFVAMEEFEFQNLVVDMNNLSEDIRVRLEARAERIFRQIRQQFPLQKKYRGCCPCLHRDKQSKSVVIDYTNITAKTWKFYSSRTLSIEVVNENDELELVYFPKLPVCDSLPEAAKKRFQENVDRSSSQEKSRSLFREFHALLMQTQNAHRLKRTYCLGILNVGFLSRLVPVMSIITYMLILAMNMLLLVYPTGTSTNSSDYNSTSPADAGIFDPFTNIFLGDNLRSSWFLPTFLFPCTCALTLLMLLFTVRFTFFLCITCYDYNDNISALISTYQKSYHRSYLP